MLCMAPGDGHANEGAIYTAIYIYKHIITILTHELCMYTPGPWACRPCQLEGRSALKAVQHLPGTRDTLYHGYEVILTQGAAFKRLLGSTTKIFTDYHNYWTFQGQGPLFWICPFLGFRDL